MMEIKELKEILQDKGYSIHFTSDNGNYVSMMKYIEDKDVTVHATIIGGEDMVTLSCMLGLFEIKSGKFAITHPRFEDMFEDKLINMVYKIKYSTL